MTQVSKYFADSTARCQPTPSSDPRTGLHEYARSKTRGRDIIKAALRTQPVWDTGAAPHRTHPAGPVRGSSHRRKGPRTGLLVPGRHVLVVDPGVGPFQAVA